METTPAATAMYEITFDQQFVDEEVDEGVCQIPSNIAREMVVPLASLRPSDWGDLDFGLACYPGAWGHIALGHHRTPGNQREPVTKTWRDES